ncbi:MAG: hypothetical protein HY782_07890 [Chloroflexi bacterium]|nr:hypothetical protein [Chloroflexota bacterium]
MKFQKKEFDSVKDFLQWFDQVREQVIIFRTFGAGSLIVVYAECEFRELNVPVAEFAC